MKSKGSHERALTNVSLLQPVDENKRQMLRTNERYIPHDKQDHHIINYSKVGADDNQMLS